MYDFMYIDIELCWILDMRFCDLCILLMLFIYYFQSYYCIGANVLRFLLGCKVHPPPFIFSFSELQDAHSRLLFGITDERMIRYSILDIQLDNRRN